MPQLTDTELIELIRTGQCAECTHRAQDGPALTKEEQHRCDALRSVWVALGKWAPKAPSRDLWPRIEAAVRRLEGRLDPAEYVRRTNGAMRHLWEQLDEWQLPDTQSDLWPRIAQAVEHEPTPTVDKPRGLLRRILAFLFGRRSD